jgi:hypothetical protein
MQRAAFYWKCMKNLIMGNIKIRMTSLPHTEAVTSSAPFKQKYSLRHQHIGTVQLLADNLTARLLKIQVKTF